MPDRVKIAAALKKEASSLTPSEMEQNLWSCVKKVNAGLEYYEKVRKIVVLEKDFPEEVRSVTAFQKIKVDRKAVAEIYRREIEGIYR